MKTDTCKATVISGHLFPPQHECYLRDGHVGLHRCGACDAPFKSPPRR